MTISAEIILLTHVLVCVVCEGTKDAPTEDRQWSPLAGGNRLVDAEGQFDHMIIGGDTALDEAAIKVDMMTDSLSKLYRESEHYST